MADDFNPDRYHDTYQEQLRTDRHTKLRRWAGDYRRGPAGLDEAKTSPTCSPNWRGQRERARRPTQASQRLREQPVDQAGQ